MGDYDEDIAKLEAILDAGADEVIVDGQKVKYNLKHVQKRLNYYKRLNGDISKRPLRTTKL